ncbi:hypothetical protein CHUAL_013355 [Chamberlinius hualienensis]
MSSKGDINRRVLAIQAKKKRSKPPKSKLKLDKQEGREVRRHERTSNGRAEDHR